MTFSPWTFFRAPAAENLSCSTAELALFTRQLSTLLNAGVPLVSGLETLSRGSDVLATRVCPLLGRRLSQGGRFSSTLRSFPRIFNQTYVAIIRGAEETGTLHKDLDQLATWLERQDKIYRHVRRAMTYPCLVTVVTAVLTIILFRTVIPKILEAVVGMGAALPAPTKLLLGAVHLAESPWTWLALVIVGVALVGYLRTPAGWKELTRVLLAIPFVGKTLRLAASARLSLTLSILLAGGCEVLRGCAIAASSSGLPQMADDADRVLLALREGKLMSQVYSESDLYPALLWDMLRAGEESGRLPEMLSHAGTLFEEETYARLEIFINLLEPLALGCVSAGVGFILIGVIMPMSTMLQAL